MKNFSEAIITRQDLHVSLIIELRAVGHCPLRYTINGDLEYFGTLVGNNIFIKHIPLNDPINIKMSIDRSHPQAVEITRLAIDGNEILPIYQHLASPSTTYLDFTGEWSLTIPPFYLWYHTITGQGWTA